MKLKAVFAPAALVAALSLAGSATIRVAPANAAPAPVALRHASDSETQNFAGKIVSQNGVRYILRDDQANVWYHIDDQQQAAKFLGKTVTITGTLDGQTDMIHVRTITESAS